MFFNLVFLVLSLLLFFDLIYYYFLYFFLMGLVYYYIVNIIIYDYFLYFFVDNISYLLVILSFYIIMLINIYLFNFDDNKIMYLFNLLVFFLFYCFFVNNLILMYVFFEACLLPLMIVIFLNGLTMERLKASTYLMLYTLFGSFIFLLMVIVMDVSLNMVLVKLKAFNMETSYLWVLGVFIFLIKMPMYGVHIWLTKAHVEAPVYGSMVLAGILLKLGGYGLYCLMNYLSIVKFKILSCSILSISLMGALMISVICLRQMDVKLIIACSSVSHMSMVLGGMFSFSEMGLWGSVGLMYAHGLCSSGMFFFSNILYDRLYTRNLIFFKGLFYIYPFLVYLWILFNLINMGFPPFMNFFFELILVFSIINNSLFFIFLLSINLMLVVFYSLLLFCRLGHGNTYLYQYIIKNLSFLELKILIFHLFYLFLFLMKISFIICLV
ncbi:NADH dehydrogenase subunit 4 (mitochondrion) [Galendromus occidentalis]|uniref:NADH-ubiquinone oxidoreductase chain 4 n=1 Tax=Galendromus occidentalis TaxID=34638 RepID=A3RE63_9ACAR|nr:NADH dehydrogenase subunit 4 [Galendromus occidentalis]ABN45848.1 NADH dehydrogenase subunit 4 [Galendromus occidentalis]